ncbi:NAD(P)-dependent oxidoreductase [Gordonia sp. zg691]|uniref:NAD(P)-dependent oxidoreductase n=1 Tax=Gordonia jinghuaiqii TaxID=2758710 RepID=A0A7D7R4N6_9ACTN|nr:NAD(P)-dependent oxidoreductase [Gordonia jinghuaiqii]MBD0862229.1 NAD(P)-dependent oxidoreductase [Gordonia jinghuaiqii]MCR5978547.1 NAD-binding protein [Gordonia jinghuaiqii]QMT02872.1 NAD(P)-dependent oxidoreductase [Gordonia jinghuaiqii]
MTTAPETSSIPADAATYSVGIIGLGAMGGSVAHRLVTAGFQTFVRDLDPEAVTRLTDQGASIMTDESVAGLDVVFTSLPDDRILRAAVLDTGLLAQLRGKMLIDLSTTLPSTIEEIAAQALPLDVRVVDAPVSGGPPEAREGRLVLMVGASDADLEAARPFLDAIGVIQHVGGVGKGKAIKIVNNQMAMGNVAVAVEAFALGRKLGLDGQRLYDVINQSGGRSFHFSKRIPYVLEKDLSPRFALYLAEKDLRLALTVAHEESFSMPAAAAIHQIFEAGRAKGLGQLDSVALIRLYEEMAGIDAAGTD